MMNSLGDGNYVFLQNKEQGPTFHITKITSPGEKRRRAYCALGKPRALQELALLRSTAAGASRARLALLVLPVGTGAQATQAEIAGALAATHPDVKK